MVVTCWLVFEDEVSLDSNSSRLGPVDVAALTISVITNKPSPSPPRIKLSSHEVTDPAES